MFGATDTINQSYKSERQTGRGVFSRCLKERKLVCLSFSFYWPLAMVRERLMTGQWCLRGLKIVRKNWSYPAAQWALAAPQPPALQTCFSLDLVSHISPWSVILGQWHTVTQGWLLSSDYINSYHSALQDLPKVFKIILIFLLLITTTCTVGIRSSLALTCKRRRSSGTGFCTQILARLPPMDRCLQKSYLQNCVSKSMLPPNKQDIQGWIPSS